MRRRSFVLGLLGALVAAPALALPALDLSPAVPSAGEPKVEEAKWGRGRGWGRGGNPFPRGRARRVRRGWYRPRHRRW
jgi:hypothetical protein